MAKQSFPYTTFTDPAGNPLSNGYVQIYIIDDAQSSTGLLCRGMTLQVSLDGNGVMVSVPQVWPNDELEPDGTYYVLKTYTSVGELAQGPLKVTV